MKRKAYGLEMSEIASKNIVEKQKNSHKSLSAEIQVQTQHSKYKNISNKDKKLK